VAPAASPLDPVLTAVRERLSRPLPGLDKAEAAAIVAFYDRRTQPLFIAHGTWNGRAESTLVELSRADDWGLSAKSFAVARPAPGADAAGLAEAEVSLVAATLSYARQASGGRVDPSTLSRYNDLRGTFADPADVLAGLAAWEKPATFLLSLHPQHAQYQLLHKALMQLRQGKAAPAAEPVSGGPDPVPASGPVLKAGQRHPDVLAIRLRLGVEADPGEDDLLDADLVTALKAFQKERGQKPTGVIGPQTRAALAEKAPAKRKPADAGREIERIVLNMERWRWMPRDLGAFHILNNIPEFTTRVVKNGQVIHQERIIVGKTSNPTSVFSAQMRTLVFQPEWGVPDSIKVKEIWPSLRRQGSDDFFGFGGADTRVLQKHNMRVVRNGQVVDASKINWSQVDPRQYSFIQGAGGANVLGVVKFLFPNRHDIYMHDTPQRDLFNNAVGAYSHGCMRVRNPRRLAEIILAEAENEPWSAEKVGAAIASKATQDVKLDKPFWVHSVYLTARVDEATGAVATFADLYGHDARLVSAMAGKPPKLEEEGKSLVAAEVRKKINPQSGGGQGSGDLGQFLSGLFGN
jgi:murein L,D-transpeptidase YcbB/YkuD